FAPLAAPSGPPPHAVGAVSRKSRAPGAEPGRGSAHPASAAVVTPSAHGPARTSGVHHRTACRLPACAAPSVAETAHTRERGCQSEPPSPGLSTRLATGCPRRSYAATAGALQARGPCPARHAHQIALG